MNEPDTEHTPGSRERPDQTGGAKPHARIWRLLGSVVLGLVAVLIVLIVPSLLWLIPAPLRARPELTLLGLVIVLEAGLRRIWRKLPGGLRARKGLAAVARAHGKLEIAAERLMGWPLRVGIGVIVLVWIASWAPHYLTWPFWTDLNHFMDMARNWDRGILPYRDHRAYNLPGQAYLCWLVGKLFGWGNLRLVLVWDVLLLVGVLAGMVRASRVWVGEALPGLVAGLGLTWYLCGAHYAMAAQRDEQASLLLALAWLAPWWRFGWRGTVISIVAFAAAATLRPQVVLFLPAIGLAVYHAQVQVDGRGGWRAVWGWGGGLLIGVVLAYAPLWTADLLDDLIAGVRMSGYGGPLSRLTGSEFAERMRANLTWPLTMPLWAGMVLSAWRGPAAVRGAAWSGLLLFWGAMLYRPISPRDHFYLEHPLVILAMACLVPVLSAGMAWRTMPALARLAGVCLAICVISPSVPRYCDAGRSLRAVGDLMANRIPEAVPLGAWDFFKHGDKVTGSYEWREVRAAVEYLRKHTRPDTDVVNLLRQPPFPTLTGMAGRPSPFRCEGGLFWASWGPPEPEEHFLGDLERASADSVVVWVPDETAADPGMRLPCVTDFFREHYAQEARFGQIEVWRRR
jgi:hypothetical protein